MTRRRTSPIMVGREADLAALEDAFAAREEQPVCLLGGEAGVGKTRVAAELAERTAAAGVLVVRGCCLELGADALPFAPFAESLDRLVEHPDALDQALPGLDRRALGPLLPSWRDEPAVRGTVGGDRGRLYEAVRVLLDGVPKPLLLVLEDLHWADRSSLELLSYLTRRLRGGRTLVLGTFRTDELHRRHPLVPVLAELARSGRARRLDLAPLAPPDVARLVAEIRGEAASPGLVRVVAARSGGNPFYVEELLTLGAGPSAPLPGTLRELLLARLGELGEDARRVLEVVAVAGRPVDMELLDRAWNESPQRLDGALREAIERAVLVVEPGDSRIGFRHALLAEAVDDDLLPGERVRLHARLAHLLVEHPDLGPAAVAAATAEVAHHWVAARELPLAVEASVRAGDAARAARAHPEAAAMFERALELWERVPDAPARAGMDHPDLLDRAAYASFMGGDVPRAVALQRQAVAESNGATEPVRTAFRVARLGEWVEELGRFEEQAELADRAVALLRDTPGSMERAFATCLLAASRMHRLGGADESIRAARETIGLAAACGVPWIESAGHAILAVTLPGFCRGAEAIGEADLAVFLAEAGGASDIVLIAHINRVYAHLELRRPADAARALEAGRRAADREGAPDVTESWWSSAEARLRVLEGRWDEAEQVAARALAGEPAHSTRVPLLAARGVLRVLCGDVDEGAADLEAVLGAVPAAEADYRAEAWIGLAWLALGRGQPERAAEIVDRALEVLGPFQNVAMQAHLAALRIRAAADTVERARARRVPADDAQVAAAEGVAEAQIARLEAALAGRLVPGAGVDDRVRALAAWGLAEAGRAHGRSDPGSWAAAAEALDAVHHLYLAAVCRLQLAEALLEAGGDRRAAGDALRAALGRTVSLGARPLEAQIRDLARRARIDLTAAQATGAASLATAGASPGVSGAPLPGAAAPLPGAAALRSVAGDPWGLSPREREVLALLVEGRTNREIGELLFISEKTASVHVTHILDKLGVTSRGAAAAVAVRAGFGG